MNTPGGSTYFKSLLSVVSPLFSSLLATMICWGASTPNQEGNSTITITVTNQTDQAVATNRPSSSALIPGVSDILTMADAGVSMEVIKTYVEGSSTVYQPNDADIIALKKHHVADDVVLLMLKRSAQVRAAIAQARNEAETRALSTRIMAAGGFDPDSYDYFQYYYLQPRTLASVYQRLSPYYPSFSYAYRYPSTFMFRAPFSSGPPYWRYPGSPLGMRR